MNLNFKEFLLKTTKASNCKEIEIIQSLWSGYGKISRYKLQDSNFKTVVVKFIELNVTKSHPRGWNTNFSHQRKVKSYKVETSWYKEWSSFCNEKCKIPQLIGVFSEDENQWIVLEDLNNDYPVRVNNITLNQVKVSLQWLANFHAIFLGKPPKDLWEIGTYWHLKTRPDEFEEMKSSQLKNKAKEIDYLLNNCKYKTIVHGDAKLANFCFSEDIKRVAAVDFQYVGGGCGMKDVAYFLGSCLSSSELEMYEAELLNYYFDELKKSIIIKDFNFSDLEHEWRKLYSFACADFMRFLLGWMPTHQKINEYNLKKIEEILQII